VAQILRRAPAISRPHAGAAPSLRLTLAPYRPPASLRQQSRSRGAAAVSMVESPIAGASVSKDGFVVFLSYQEQGRYFEQDKLIPLVISPVDTEKVQSPEALTFLQLLQGIDMATPLLPPDALKRQYEEEGEVALSEVHMYPPQDARGTSERGPDSQLDTDRVLELSGEQQERRETKIQEKAPDLVKALKTLNLDVDLDRAVSLLRSHASEDGDLDRNAFSTVLAAARVPVNIQPAGSLPIFTLVALTENSVGREVNVSAFVGLSLHLRHKVPLVIKGGRRAPGNGKVSRFIPPLLADTLCIFSPCSLLPAPYAIFALRPY
jgi:hypothetical protein